MLIGNRTIPVVVLGAIAQWKDGEQLRFWASFWMVFSMVSFQDAFGALEYFEEDSKKWAQFIVGLLIGAAGMFNLMTVHKQINGNGQGGNSQVTSMNMGKMGNNFNQGG